jgi:hypothetical protein
MAISFAFVSTTSTWHILMTHVTVNDGERALLTRNGRLERVLEAGRHRLFDPRHELTAEMFNVVRAEFPAERYAVLNAARPDLATDRNRTGAFRFNPDALHELQLRLHSAEHETANRLAPVGISESPNPWPSEEAG